MERSIEASTTIRVAFARAREVLLDDPGAVFSEAHTVDERRERRFSMDMGVDLGAGASVHQAVTLQLGAPRSVDHGLVLPMSWRADGREQMLPTFEGELETSEARPGTRLRLTGTYTVPLGVVGRFGDGVLGRRLARRSLNALVQRLASRLESQVQARIDSVGWRPAPHPDSFREQDHSEIYVG
jgi:hypothetical protein